ncbi:transcription termination/antitermination protein NusG [Tychonema sp. LEGE 07199]|uniref:transcription termination/antitermination protein NusG n=1 Tax=Microcoleaceae TaxID=1892252 RepID=UPI00187FDB61|nr:MULTISPECIES: transcription termination/antitermination protein NusG [unclassified Tychonema]MBE9123358.1 transcription termination/antitermination protein NusG [Tychonema sp. LEGE 07199]MBE9135499.1 transcription termination/antitermination protein NusG [Tychonema sp. LEGE 07196]
MTFASEESEYSTEATGQASSADVPEIDARWYAVQVASGCEKRVKANLDQRIQTLDVADRIVQVEIPQTPAIKVGKDGSRRQSDEKIFPGYVLIRMFMDEDTWQVIKNTPNVINFVGAEQKRRYGRGRGHVKPLPLSHSEVERIFRNAQESEPVVKVSMATGDHVVVLSGPFKDFEGDVIEVSPERNKLKVLLSIFGRDTPVELEFNQVQKQN